MTTKRASGESDEGLTFEQAIERLEAIAERIESGEIGLEKSIAEYERGMALIARCKEILQKAEQRVDELNRRASGSGSGPGGPAQDDAPDSDKDR